MLEIVNRRSVVIVFGVVAIVVAVAFVAAALRGDLASYHSVLWWDNRAMRDRPVDV